MSKTVFVVMPFTSTPTRNKSELSAFFQENLKEAVERRPINGERYIVKRSDDTFNINEQVVRDLYKADVVIADLSGREANPNVMYELGLRLAVSNKPVILIREAHHENRTIFDIAGFHIFFYSPAHYQQLEAYIMTKIERFASKAEDYRSPVLSVLEQEPSIVRRIEADRLYNRLTAASHTIYDLRRSVSSRIAEFCKGKIDVSFSEVINEFQKQFAANYGQLERLDWSSARIRVRPDPSLLNLVSEPPDDKLIGAEHYKALMPYLNEFYTSLFAFDDDWKFNQIAILIGEGPLLEDLVDATRRMLSEDELAVAYGKSEFRRVLGKSSFGWHVGIQHFLSLPDETADQRPLAIPMGTGVFETDKKLLEVIDSAWTAGLSGPEMLAVLEQELRGSGASGASLEAVLNDFASQLNVRRATPAGTRESLATPVSIGLADGTAGEIDPAQRRALVEQVETHTQHGHEPAVLDVARALYNATVGEPDPAQRRALAARIETLHTEHGHEPAVREQLARALYNATVVEPDKGQRRALAERIETLHEQYGHEPAVRERLAAALVNATAVERDPTQRRALAARIETLHEQYGHEPAVREQLAKALFNATVGEADPVQRRALAARIETLHEQYGHEPAVREHLTKALVSETASRDAAQCRALAEQIETLHTQYGYEPGVREQLAAALVNATVSDADPAQVRALVERIETLHTEYGHEPAVREQLAKALFNAIAVEPDPAQRRALVDRIEALHTQHGQEPSVREQIAAALYNATAAEPDVTQRRALAARIETLHTQHGHEPAVRERLARALYNATVVEPDKAQRRALAERIETLHEQYGHEPAVRERLAAALVNATIGEADPVQRRALAERLETLHDQYGHEPAVREQLVMALVNAAVGEPDLARANLVTRLECLAAEHPGESLLAAALTRARGR